MENRSDSQQSATVVVVDVFIYVAGVVGVGVFVAVVDDLQLIINPIHHPYLSLIPDKIFFHVAVEFDIILPLVLLFIFF